MKMEARVLCEQTDTFLVSVYYVNEKGNKVPELGVTIPAQSFDHARAIVKALNNDPNDRLNPNNQRR